MRHLPAGWLATAVLCCAAGAAQAGEGPALWSVAGERNTVYLFGSVHLLRAGEFGLQGRLADAYEDAEAVFLEVDMDDLSPAQVAGATVSLAIDPEGRGLFELMGPDADEEGRIEDLLDDDRDYLAVVGALHLVGPDGLPAMLRARGIPVTRH